MEFTLRKATLDDRPAIARLIQHSARGLSREDYSEEQIEAAIESVYGVDTDLIEDGTYFVAEAGGMVVGCGGWSRRRKLFGGDQVAPGEAEALDPGRDPARIRAFFIHPDWARRGLGRAILAWCEAEARAQRFRALELMSTLPGIKLYRSAGYLEGDRVEHVIGKGVRIEFVPMRKELV